MVSIEVEVGEAYVLSLPRGWYVIRLFGVPHEVYSARLRVDIGRGCCAAHSIGLWRFGGELAAVARLSKTSRRMSFAAADWRGALPDQQLLLVCDPLPLWRLGLFRVIEAFLLLWALLTRPRHFVGLYGTPFLRYLRFRGLFSFPHQWAIRSRYEEWIYREEVLPQRNTSQRSLTNQSVYVCSVDDDPVWPPAGGIGVVRHCRLPADSPFSALVRIARQYPESIILYVEKGFVLNDAVIEGVVASIPGREASVIYGDSDVLVGGVRSDPCFRWGFSVERSQWEDCFGPVIAFRGGVLSRVQVEGPDPSRSFFLRSVIAVAGKNGVEHVPAILAHRTGAAEPASRDDQGIGQPDTVGGGRLEELLVSIIIPTKDRLDLISRAVSSIIRLTHGIQYEIIVIDHDSSDSDTVSWLNAKHLAGKIRIVPFSGAFNFSAMNNSAAKIARGQIIAFLNNDIEVVATDWLVRLVEQVVRPEIGCAGALLLYPNGTVQHDGITLGIGGIGAHVFRACSVAAFQPDVGPGTFRNVSAITGACLVVRKVLFERIGGFNERDLAVSFNDVDLCLRAVEEGFRNVYVPAARLVHHESATRSRDDLSGRDARVLAEIKYMRERWGDVLDADPFYSPALDLTRPGAGIRV